MTIKEDHEIMWQDKEWSTRRALALISDMPALYHHSKESMRVHGNGFIQIDMAPHLRLHIWDEAIPHQATNTPIHDHRFGFESLILTGMLVNVEYQVAPPPPGAPLAPGHYYHLYTPIVRQGEDTVLVKVDNKEYLVGEIATREHRAGETYSFEAMEFHETKHNGLTATLMRKVIEYPRHTPRIVCPSYTKPDNDFNRYQVDLDMMWAIVEEVSQKVRETPPGELS